MIATLRQANHHELVMLTGDNPVVAEGVARQIGIEEFQAGLLPEEKVGVIETLSRTGKKVAMIGDGVNDAPALVASDVGVAMGAAGSDTAIEVADIALLSDDLSKVPYLLRLGKKTMRVVKANIIVAIAVKLLFTILVFPGLVTLWMAVAIGDMGVSLAVILNALRLSRVR
jgi:Cd2+/Zn2+-exporting ATPase